jgi:hypothetical protein
MKTNYTDTKLQAAIDEACDKLAQSTRVYLNALDLDNTTESWPVEASARLDLIKSALAALPEPVDEESMLLNLLAVIHRDGGHYQAEHGTRKAVQDACKEWQRLILIAEKTGLTEPPTVDGMSLRDYFAGQALAGLLVNRGAKFWDGDARNAYVAADAMIKAREVKP